MFSSALQIFIVNSFSHFLPKFSHVVTGDKNLASDAEFRIHGTIDVINLAFHRKISSTFPFISASINAEVRELSNDACRMSINDVTHRYCSIAMHHVCTRSRCSVSNWRNQLLQIKQSRHLQIITPVLIERLYFSFKKTY